MKNFFRQKLVRSCALLFAASMMLSANVKAGGESYEIYLNNKLICKQVNGKILCGDKGLVLSKANMNDNLVITYSHCGRVGTGRKVAVKNDHDRTLKEWTFADNATITIPVKELLTLEKNKTALKLYYSSTQYLPEGRMLTSVKLGGKELAKTDGKGTYWPLYAATIMALKILFLC